MQEDSNNGHHTAKSTFRFQSYLHGGTSSLISTLTTVITFPVYKTVYRQQLHSILVRQAVAQLLKEGPVKLYRGVVPPLLMRSLNGGLLFGLQDTLQQQLSAWPLPPGTEPFFPALSGLGAGVVEALFFTPFERVQNILQNNKNDLRHPSMRSILWKLSTRTLASGYYTGFLPVLVRNALGNGLYFGLKNPISKTLSASGFSPVAASFSSGVLNSLLISLPLYPLSVLVANMQAEIQGGKQEVRGIKSSWQQLFASRGNRVILLYRGGSLVILRSCITWGITTAIYDQLERYRR